jgi:hypothetical protein
VLADHVDLRALHVVGAEQPELLGQEALDGLGLANLGLAVDVENGDAAMRRAGSAE